MDPSFSAASEQRATLACNEQLALPRPDDCQKAAERKISATRNIRSLLLDALYWLYERRLRGQIEARTMPRHVGIILDGNRRHGRQRGLNDPLEIYQRGADKLDDVLEWCAELGIPAVTLWVFSTENVKRPPIEVSGILAAIEAKVAALAVHPFMHKKRVRLQAIGKLGILPVSLLAAINSAEAATAQYDAMTLTIAVAYGGREEIVHAVRSFLEGASRGRSVIAGCYREDHARGSRPLSLCGGSARSRSDYSNERRNPSVGFPSLAERA
jgi:undecaprenyl diphosphate synthase